MKKEFLLIVICILGFSCSQENHKSVAGDPADIHLFLELFNSDGTPMKEGDVFHWQQYEDNGKLSAHPEEWHLLRKTYNERLGSDLYFMPEGEFRYGWELGEEPKIGTRWVNKAFLYLKYANSDVVDTLVVRDSLHYPEYRYFDLFLNGEKYENFLNISMEWLVTITKEEE